MELKAVKGAPRLASLLEVMAQADSTPADFEADPCPSYRLCFAPDKRTHGYIHPKTISRMHWPSAFRVDHGQRVVTLQEPPEHVSFEEHANVSLQCVVDRAIEDSSNFPSVRGQHSELLRIPGVNGNVSLERFAVSLFGIAAQGSCLVGYSRSKQNELQIWVSKRSSSVCTFPGYLDCTVSGGVKATQNPTECILVEAAEEASLPSQVLSQSLQSTGTITLTRFSKQTELFYSVIIFTFELEVPADVTPHPSDGESQGFMPISCSEARDHLLAGNFKPDTAAVIIDFLIRHGEVTSKTEGALAFTELCTRLRRRLPVAILPDTSKRQMELGQCK